MNYIRATTFKKNCKLNNITIKTKQIDEYVWLFGKRHPNSYHPHHNAIDLKF